MVVAQSGGPSPVINNSLRGIIEAAQELRRDRHRLRRRGTASRACSRKSCSTCRPSRPKRLRCCGSRRRPARSAPAATSSSPRRPRISSASSRFSKPTTSATSSTSAATTRWTRPTRSPTLAHKRGLDLVAVGVPKTIDNDVGDSEFKLIDHTPGYGSVAKYWMHMVQNANEENAGSSPADPVLVMQAMGRKIGFIPAAARLADPGREMPLQIYLAESPCTLAATGRPRERPVAAVRAAAWSSSAKASTSASMGEVQDSFGHVSCSARARRPSARRSSIISIAVGLACKGAARGNVSGTDQRHAMAYASTVDLEEAYRSGQMAALLAARGESGFMATILRDPGPIYHVRYDKVPLAEVAASERSFPAALDRAEWLRRDRRISSATPGRWSAKTWSACRWSTAGSG